MSVTYPAAVKNARLNAVTTAIGATGVLEIGTTGMATILATIPVVAPSLTPESYNLATLNLPSSLGWAGDFSQNSCFRKEAFARL